MCVACCMFVYVGVKIYIRSDRMLLVKFLEVIMFFFFKQFADSGR